MLDPGLKILFCVYIFKIPVGPVQLVSSDNEALLRFWFVTTVWLFATVLEILWTEDIWELLNTQSGGGFLQLSAY